MDVRFERSKTGKDEWLTPLNIINSLGQFELDPCAPINRPWNTAEHHYTINDDGLKKPWFGRVWCNPPYGTQTGLWLNKCADHGNAIALTFARTETKMFHQYVFNRADSILFMRRRITFFHASGEKANMCAGSPSCLIAYGKENSYSLKHSGIDGKYISLNNTEVVGE